MNGGNNTYREITLSARLIQGRSRDLASTLTPFIPGAGPDAHHGLPLLHLLVQDVEDGPRVRRLALPEEERAGCGRAVHHHGRYVAQLYLEHIAISLSPLRSEGVVSQSMPTIERSGESAGIAFPEDTYYPVFI